jgi:hypothetical protein
MFLILMCDCVSRETNAAEHKSRYRIDINIGSDNDSRRISDIYLGKIKKWASEAFPDGYTILRGEGHYNGASEDSVLLHAFLDYDPALKHQLDKLKRKLNQESILVVKSTADYEVV